MKQPAHVLRADAFHVLQTCKIPAGADYDTLSNAQVHDLLQQADLRRYRKPKNANGSRARYFHDFMQRRARTK